MYAMTKSPIYNFHQGPTGPRVSTSFYSDLDTAGKRFSYKITDNAPDIGVINIARKSQLDHTIIFRRSVGAHGDIGVYDVADTNKTPFAAAVEHWQLHLDEFPREVKDNKDLVWVETINEIGRVYSEWYAEFAIETAKLAWADGYKWLAFGWAGGTPEPEHWHLPKMQEFLTLCAANRHRLGVALHEYSLSSDIWNGKANDGSMWLIGRYTHLLQACDDNGIGYPRIDVTEWGWGKDKALVPDKPQRQIDYAEVMAMYANAPIHSAAIWCLNGAASWGGIHELIQQDIGFIKDFTLNTEYEINPEPPPSTGCGKTPNTKRTFHLFPQDLTFAEFSQVAEEFHSKKNTFGYSHDDAISIETDGNGRSLIYIWEPERRNPADLDAIGACGCTWERKYFPAPPVDEFQFTHWPTPYRIVTQEFLANPQNYEKFGLPGHDGVDIRAFHGNVVSSVADGVISHVNHDPSKSNYGIYVRVQHAESYETTYAHLKETIRTVGEAVKGGDIVGLADNTGNSFGDHLHLTLKQIGTAYTDRCGNQWKYNICDPTPYLATFDGVTWPGGSQGFPCPDEPEPPTGQHLDLTPYFLPQGTHGPKVVFRFPDGRGQPQQLVRDGADKATLWKGEGHNVGWKLVYDYEEYRVTDGILKGGDSSGDPAYHLGWAQWVPTVAHVGQVYTSSPVVRVYNRVTCETISAGPTTDYIHFKEILPVWTSPYDESIKFQNVPVFEWRKTPNINTEPIETYMLGVGVVYVQWNDGKIAEMPTGQQNLGFLKDCI